MFDRTYDPGFHRRLGRPSVQLGRWASRCSRKWRRACRSNVGYFRNWWGNWYTVDNRATTRADYDAIQHQGAGRSAAARWRWPGHQRPVRPRADRGRQGRRARNQLDNYAKQIENWQGVDVGVSARLRNGVTVQGGTSTGRRLSDACTLKAALPEQGPGHARVDRRRDRRRLAHEPVLPRRRARTARRFGGSRRIRFRRSISRSAARGATTRVPRSRRTSLPATPLSRRARNRSDGICREPPT